MTKLLNELINDKCICRTAPATLGLISINFYEHIFLIIIFTFNMKRKQVNRLFPIALKMPLFQSQGLGEFSGGGATLNLHRAWNLVK